MVRALQPGRLRHLLSCSATQQLSGLEQVIASPTLAFCICEMGIIIVLCSVCEWE